MSLSPLQSGGMQLRPAYWHARTTCQGTAETIHGNLWWNVTTMCCHFQSRDLAWRALPVPPQPATSSVELPGLNRVYLENATECVTVSLPENTSIGLKVIAKVEGPNYTSTFQKLEKCATPSFLHECWSNSSIHACITTELSLHISDFFILTTWG